jgi:hypothetical protein
VGRRALCSFFPGTSPKSLLITKCSQIAGMGSASASAAPVSGRLATLHLHPGSFAAAKVQAHSVVYRVLLHKCKAGSVVPRSRPALRGYWHKGALAQGGTGTGGTGTGGTGTWRQEGKSAEP